MQRESAKKQSAATLRKIGEEITRVAGASAPVSRGDTKSASDLGRAKRQKKKPAYRQASREAYKAAEPKQRKDVRGGKTPESAIARKQSSDFKRAEGYKREAQKFLDKGPTRADLEKVTGPRRERLDKGLRVLSKQAKAAELRNALNPELKPLEHVKPRKTSGISALPGVGEVVGAITDIGGTLDTAKSLATGERRRRRPVAEEARAAVEEKLGPLDGVQKKVIKTAADGTTKALNQLTRPASAVAGGVTDLSLRSAVKGFKENNRSFEELARKAGADGTLAEVLGLAGDIAFDPFTYGTLGASAPLNASRRSAQEAAQRALNAEGKKIQKLLDGGKVDEVEAGRRLDAAAAKQRENLERVLAKPQAKAQKQRAASKSGEQPRALQVGFRAAGRQKQVSVRVPGSRTVGNVARSAQQRKRLNDLTTKLSTKAPGVGVTRAQKDMLRQVEKKQRGGSNVLLRKAERVAFFLKKQEYTEPELRQIIGAVEAGTIAKLEPRLREGATRFESLTEEGRGRLETLLGKEVGLDERMLAPKELEGLAKQVSKATGDKSVRKVRATDRASERDAVATLRVAAEGAAAERLPKAVSRDVGNIIGEVRAGGQAAKEYPELAAALKAEGEGRAALAASTDPAAREAAEAQVKAARASVKEHRTALAKQVEAEYAEQGLSRFKGRTGKVAAPLADAERKVAKETPRGYVPRYDDTGLRARFGDKEAAKQVNLPKHSGAKADAEHARVQNRERRDQMDEGVGDNLSIDMPLLAANFGLNVAGRTYSGGVRQEVLRRAGKRPTAETIENATTPLVAYRLIPGDVPKKLTDKEQADLFAGKLDDTDDLRVIPEPIDADINALQNTADPGAMAQDARRILRKWKEFNTIARPGFFVNNFVSNNWQLYLLDAKVEIAKQFVVFSRMKADELLERHGPTALGKILDKFGANPTFTLLDGKRMTRADLILEAAEYGASRTGSRLGYKLDSDLSPLEQTKRQVGLAGAGGKIGAGVRKASTKAGNLAEDLDDMTRDVLYERARVKLGMSPEEATEYVYTGMIDYGDLTDYEQRVMKILMPFYVYTSRNVPIQVKKLMQRPGKVANFEKVVEQLADSAGLPADWEGLLTEGDQERMPVPVPQGLAKAIRSVPGGSAIMPEGQSFRDIRLPVSDLRRPAQALDGLKGLERVVEQYAADIGPYLRIFPEMKFNRRFDYDRPIYGSDARKSEAGTLATGLEKLLGWNSKPTEIDKRTGEKYNTTSNVVNYLVRQLGSYPSLAQGVGTKSADTTGRTIGVRAADSLIGQGSIVPDVNETLLYGNVGQEVDRLYAKRKALENEGKEGTVEHIKLGDRIEDVEAVRAGLQLLAGYEGRVGARARDKARGARDRRTSPRDPAKIRAIEYRLRKLLERIEEGP